MKNIFTTILVLINFQFSFFNFQLLAQPTIEWQKCLGGNADDYCYSIQQTKDAGYILAGWTFSKDGDASGNHGICDYWVVKLNSSGNLLWQKSLGGSNGDYAFSIWQTSDDGYIVAGNTRSNDSNVSGNHSTNAFTDAWIVKLNSSGVIQWEKCYGGTNLDYASSVQQTTDGGYIFAGQTYSSDGDVSGNHGGGDVWVVKLKPNGDIDWQKCLGGSTDDNANSIQQTKDGGYIVAGNSSSNDGDVTGNHIKSDYWIVKLNSAGTIQWQKSLGGSAVEIAKSVMQTKDNGFIVTGRTASNDGDVTGFHGSLDYWVVKLNQDGNIQWEKCLGGSKVSYAVSIMQTAESGYICCGYTNANDGDVTGHHGSPDSSDYWIAKLSASGGLQWGKSLGGSNLDISTSSQLTTDGGLVVAGYSRSNDGDVSGNHGGWDCWVVKLSAFSDVEEPESGTDVAISPNPATDFLEISYTNINHTLKSVVNSSLEIYNVFGEKILSSSQYSVLYTQYSAKLDVSDLLPGVYFLKVGDTFQPFVKM